MSIIRSHLLDAFKQRATSTVESVYEGDVSVSKGEFEAISTCENCGNPVDKKKLIEAGPSEASRCSWCGDSIFTEFVMCVPSHSEDVWFASVAGDFEALVAREMER